TCVFFLYKCGSHTLVLLLYFFYCYGDHRDLHSFPTRRSSDLSLDPRVRPDLGTELARRRGDGGGDRTHSARGVSPTAQLAEWVRSEEHTSELQSRRDLVCRLLLEKKNTNHDLYDYCYHQHRRP